MQGRAKSGSKWYSFETWSEQDHTNNMMKRLFVLATSGILTGMSFKQLISRRWGEKEELNDHRTAWRAPVYRNERNCVTCLQATLFSNSVLDYIGPNAPFMSVRCPERNFISWKPGSLLCNSTVLLNISNRRHWIVCDTSKLGDRNA